MPASSRVQRNNRRREREHREASAQANVTHLRDATGRPVHVIGWSQERIAEWREEQRLLAGTSEAKGPGQTAQMNQRIRLVFTYILLFGGSALAIYWLGVGW